MRFIFLLSIILISSCETKKVTIASRQQAIKDEMELVKKSYFKKQDSLENAKRAETNSANHIKIAAELVEADKEKSARLIKLQKKYNSLGVELNRH